MNSILKKGLLGIFALAQLTVSLAGDWPEWRGENRDGLSREKGLLPSWPEGGPKLSWKITGLGKGYATVAIADNRIYTLGDKEGSAEVIALNEKDGSVAWSTPIGKVGAAGWGGFEGPRSTPTIHEGRVYAIGQWGEFICLDGKTGKELWRKDFAKDFGATRPEWGFSESPLVDGNQVVFTPGGKQGALVALNKKTGEVLWQSKEFTDAAHYSSIIIGEIDGVRQYIQLTDKSVVGIAPKTGALLWQVARKGSTAVIPTPIYADNHVYVTSGYGIGCNLFKVQKTGETFKAEQVYANKVMVNHHGGVVKVGDHVYGYSDGKGWTCQNFKTGEAVWQEKTKLGKGAVLFADKRLYCRAEDGKGTVALLEATPEGYKEVGRLDQPDRSGKNTWAHPVIAGGKLYLRDHDVLLCYDIKAK